MSKKPFNFVEFVSGMSNVHDIDEFCTNPIMRKDSPYFKALCIEFEKSLPFVPYSKPNAQPPSQMHGGTRNRANDDGTGGLSLLLGGSNAASYDPEMPGLMRTMTSSTSRTRPVLSSSSVASTSSTAAASTSSAAGSTSSSAAVPSIYSAVTASTSSAAASRLPSVAVSTLPSAGAATLYSGAASTLPSAAASTFPSVAAPTLYSVSASTWTSVAAPTLYLGAASRSSSAVASRSYSSAAVSRSSPAGSSRSSSAAASRSSAAAAARRAEACKHCKKVYATAKDKIAHRGLKGTHPCHICPDVEFGCDEAFAMHIYEVHGQYLRSKQAPTCELCNKTMNSRNGLVMHYLTHITTRSYECEFCIKVGSAFKVKTRRALINHLEKTHRHQL